MKFDYFYNEQSESYSFYRTPKVLFTDDRLADITNRDGIITDGVGY